MMCVSHRGYDSTLLSAWSLNRESRWYRGYRLFVLDRSLISVRDFFVALTENDTHRRFYTYYRGDLSENGYSPFPSEALL